MGALSQVMFKSEAKIMKIIPVITGLAAILIAGLSGCSSIEKNYSGAKPVDYSLLDASAQRKLVEGELRVIGDALKEYKKDHEGQLPPDLTTLVLDKYLDSKDIVSSADPSCGKEGGVPDQYKTWGQANEADEPASSYLYEFSAKVCSWDWNAYLAGKPSSDKLDINRDGVVSWAEVKNWQMSHGDTVQQPKGNYPKAAFPVVRCYWYNYPDAYTPEADAKSVLNLAVDLKTVFISQPWWEKDFSR